MKKDINIYNYHTVCPNCKGFNTRLSKAIDFRALCYSCSLFFKPSDIEIKKMSTPLPVQMAIHPSMQNLSEKQLDYIKNIHDVNIKAKNESTLILQKEIRQATTNIINQYGPKNCLILSDFDEKIETEFRTNLVNDTDTKLIEKNIYKNILKFGKIDCLIIENLSNIILSELLSAITPSIETSAKYIIYVPVFENIYNQYHNYIKNSNYVYNTYTICREFNNIYCNIFNFTKLNNFYQYEIKYGVNLTTDFNEKIKNISKKEMKNIIYSEPLFIIK